MQTPYDESKLVYPNPASWSDTLYDFIESWEEDTAAELNELARAEPGEDEDELARYYPTGFLASRQEINGHSFWMPLALADIPMV